MVHVLNCHQLPTWPRWNSCEQRISFKKTSAMYTQYGRSVLAKLDVPIPASGAGFVNCCLLSQSRACVGLPHLQEDGNLQEVTRPLSLQTDYTNVKQTVIMCLRTSKGHLVQVQHPETIELSGLVNEVQLTVALVPSKV